MTDVTTLQRPPTAKTAGPVFSYHPRLTLPAHIRQAAHPAMSPEPGEDLFPNKGLCLTAGTRLITSRGRLSVERFRVGTQVWTLENGFQPVVELARHALRLTAGSFAHRPVVLRRDALGKGAPLRDIRLAPKQALVVDAWTHEPDINDAEQDVSAGQLIERDRAERDLRCKSVTYVWLGFDAPQVVEAEGILTRVR